MKKTTLNSIIKAHRNANLVSLIGSVALISIFVLPFFQLVGLAFLSVIISGTCFVLLAQFEANLNSSLNKAINELNLSMFTDKTELLKKCILINKSNK